MSGPYVIYEKLFSLSNRREAYLCEEYAVFVVFRF